MGLLQLSFDHVFPRKTCLSGPVTFIARFGITTSPVFWLVHVLQTQASASSMWKPPTAIRLPGALPCHSECILPRCRPHPTHPCPKGFHVLVASASSVAAFRQWPMADNVRLNSEPKRSGFMTNLLSTHAPSTLKPRLQRSPELRSCFKMWNPADASGPEQ